jgi:hypothetical protein
MIELHSNTPKHSSGNVTTAYLVQPNFGLNAFSSPQNMQELAKIHPPIEAMHANLRAVL